MLYSSPFVDSASIVGDQRKPVSTINRPNRPANAGWAWSA